ncbi:type II toxin-antitoxin system PemK/MazF family toxin [Pediococcus inopinatus]|uniref:Type II toxin-antitoxin system PemK/MazF family toxin n=1 Tax=Pediococcus inopinatus TaxID=114090 RepID=A0ABZ0Q525_9LACO|nr:type II toxin-antitoxin system PemK/MazF family toxin [Pediococcus inopinatus]AVK99325.1 hypothetical protein PI20285_00915 [Pediococcus inopinatus]KRN62210.1 hypothetical protein IV83_GL000320 [Pediococcus inopinatus]WPC18244.1 type II toxin-antitoxin system PemK/MazF family toxin [Pediococcus inopinatus]WPC20367.1 type II toxin-antitoxin system PemK/MazF family toxin [Pediococcus inopinatus]WPC22071.1 type II toxin-antitoxin system PemK/MazF family toxin [Pediococcus inopinatus]
MVKKPQQGDIIWLDFEPHSGHETGGHNPNKNNIRRPCLVVSATEYNETTPLVQVIPVTSTVRENDPFRQQIVDPRLGIKGMLLFQQLHGFDFQSRHGEIVGQANSKLVRLTLEAVKDIFNF